MTDLGLDLNLDHFKIWIGREEVTADVLTAGLVDRFRATLGLAGEGAPRLIHFCLAIPATPADGVGPDGHIKRGGFLPPVPLPRRMWAGGAVTFHADLKIGESIQRTSRIADVNIKHGRSGTLCFVDVDHRIIVGGRLAVEERHNIVYRGADGAATTGAPAERGEHTRVIDPTPLLLFRYSALTFNGHRIHYDYPYVTKEEGYPDLVVHGPLQATLLLHFAADLAGTAPNRFTFRGQSPLFANTPFVLHAKREGAAMRLWTARENGPVAMSAEATW